MIYFKKESKNVYCLPGNTISLLHDHLSDMTASPISMQICYLSKFSVGAGREGVFFLLMYTYDLFRSELPCRELKIKPSFLLCYKNRVYKDSLVSCLLRDSIGSVGPSVPL